MAGCPQGHRATHGVPSLPYPTLPHPQLELPPSCRPPSVCLKRWSAPCLGSIRNPTEAYRGSARTHFVVLPCLLDSS